MPRRTTALGRPPAERRALWPGSTAPSSARSPRSTDRPPVDNFSDLFSVCSHQPPPDGSSPVDLIRRLQRRSAARDPSPWTQGPWLGGTEPRRNRAALVTQEPACSVETCSEPLYVVYGPSQGAAGLPGSSASARAAPPPEEYAKRLEQLSLSERPPAPLARAPDWPGAADVEIRCRGGSMGIRELSEMRWSATEFMPLDPMPRWRAIARRAGCTRWIRAPARVRRHSPKPRWS
jgi:hypothetical protein